MYTTSATYQAAPPHANHRMQPNLQGTPGLITTRPGGAARCCPPLQATSRCGPVLQRGHLNGRVSCCLLRLSGGLDMLQRPEFEARCAGRLCKLSGGGLPHLACSVLRLRRS